MIKPTFMTGARGHQRGAALVVGLLLLLVITLLAVAGMNSAAVEFIMAGNEAFRQKAFQASEAGIEHAMINGGFVPGGAAENSGVITYTGSDTYSTALTSDLNGAPSPALWGNSPDAFSMYEFTITSTGVSVRGASATHAQGVAILAPKTTSLTPLDPTHPAWN